MYNIKLIPFNFPLSHSLQVQKVAAGYFLLALDLDWRPKWNMDAPNFTPGDRSPACEQPLEEQIFVIENEKQHGPYNTVGICLLIRMGKVTRDSLYWKAGMVGARPISDFDDDVTVHLPRQHHYGFAYAGLPQLFFTSPKFVIGTLKGNLDQLILWAWNTSGEVYGCGEIDTARGLAAERLPYDSTRTMVLVVMPTPRRETEAYFTAAIVPARIGPDSPIRYFALSHFGGLGENFPEATLREITATENFCVKPLLEASKSDFLDAVKQVCPPVVNPSKRFWF